MTDKYRINPDFIVPEPTAAKHFDYFELPATQEEFEQRRDEGFDLMRKHGAKKGRLTIIDDEHPIPPYPNGVWLEGWNDERARELPFGEADEGGVICPPLVTDAGKLASAIETQSAKTEGLGPEDESAARRGWTAKPRQRGPKAIAQNKAISHD